MNATMDFTASEILAAIDTAAIGRRKRADFAAVLADRHAWADRLLRKIRDGSYKGLIGYERLRIRNLNGKWRDILAPNCPTLILQHLCMERIQPVYDRADPHVGLNCKKGCGVNARRRGGSVTHRIKHIVYDRRDMESAVLIDQRECYKHVREPALRRAFKSLGLPRWFKNFAMSLCFHKGEFPIGTPTSPLAHHVLMLEFDKYLKKMSPMSVRYADDHFAPFATKEEAARAKWRIKNYWWYNLGIRAKRHTVRVLPLSEPFDFCGTVFHRNPDKVVVDHNKGYATVRAVIARRAIRCDSRSYPSYYGILKGLDGYGLMKHIEKNNMNLQKLTEKIRINRALDAPNIAVKDLAEAGIVFAIHDFEVRRDKSESPNWLKCLISFRDPAAAGRRVMREFHGNYQGLICFLEVCGKNYSREELLPMTQVKIINSCGYIFEGSSNMVETIDDSPEFNI